MSDLKDFYLVAIGSSAGGLEVLSQFLSYLPSKLNNASFIIAQHLSPTYKSQLANLLGRKTKIPVEEAKDKQTLKAGKIYIIPSNTDLLIEKGRIRLVKPNTIYHPSIDRLFESVAKNFGPKGIGIILSGTGRDGAEGINKIRDKEGFAYSQDPGEARYNAMPKNAISTGNVNMVAKVKDIALHLTNYISSEDSSNDFIEKIENIEKSDGGVEEKILKSLSIHKGIDFANYKTSTIQRRMVRRATQLHLNDLESYFDYIKSEIAELDILYNDFLISVTSFFRDKETFILLQEKLIELIASKKKGDLIRIWIPGCATGEEPFTIAIILNEILGETKDHFNIQILASDIDENALQKARKGLYKADSVHPIEKHILEKYFIKTGDEYEVIKPIRNNILFSKHDLTANPPFFKLDLISCRNLLIYINQKTQSQIMQFFYYALNTNGLLLLGKSESVGNYKDLFAEEDSKNKLYRKKTSLSMVPPFSIPLPLAGDHEMKESFWQEPSMKELLKDSMFRFFDAPFAIVSPEMNIVHIKGDLFPFITLKQGVMSHNILHLADESIQIELRALFTRTLKEKASVKSKIKRAQICERDYVFQVQIFPIPAEKTGNELYIIVFEQLEGEVLNLSIPLDTAELKDNKRVLELEEELREIKEQLQSFIEELETTNEEMQSLNEELQSTNEELQAAIEELETSNEELQSASEEMLVAYNELQELHRLLEEKDKSLQKSSNQFNTLLEYSDQAYILIDNNYRIVTFNKKSNYIIEQTNEKRLKESDSIFNFVPSNYLSSFKANLDLALDGKSTTLEDFVPSEKGDLWLRVKYTPVYGVGNDIDNVLVSYIDLTSEIKTNKLIAYSEANLVSFIENNNGMIYSIDTDYRYVIINSNFKRMVKDSLGEEINPGDHAFNFLKKISPAEYESWDNIYERAFDGEFIQFVKESSLTKEAKYWEFFINPIKESGKIIGLSCSAYDITEKILNERKLRESEIRFRALIENSNDLVSMIDKEGKTIYSSPSLERIIEGESIPNNETSWFNFIHPEDIDHTLKTLERALEYPGFPIHHTLRLMSKSNDYKYLEGTLTNLNEVEGVNAIVANFKDVSERVRAEQEKILSQNFFKAIIENSLDMKVLFSADGSIVYGSPSISRFLGYKEEEFKQKRLFELIHPDDIQRLGKGIESLFSTPNTTLSIEQRILDKAGRYLWCEGSISNLLHSPNVQSLVYNFRDISERKEASDKLQQTHALLKDALNDNEKILNHSLDVICSIDEDGKFSKISAASKEVWGYEPHELVGKKYMDYVYAEDHEITNKAAEDVMGGVEKTNFENRYVRKDGSLVPILWSARWEKSEKTMYCIAKNASEKKRLEKAFEAEKERFSDLFFKAPACMGIVKGKKHIYEMVNPQYLKLFGKKDIIGKEVEVVFPELNEQGFIEILDKVYETGETYTTHESLINIDYNNDGILTALYLDFALQAFRNKEGHIEGIFVFAVDVSEQVVSRKKIEESEMKYRSFFENSMDGILLTVLEGEILAANPAACKIFGMTEEEIYEKGRLGLVDPNDPNVIALINERRKNGKVKGELTYIRKDGSKFPGEITSVEFKNGFGEERTCMIIRDMSERKKAEEKLLNSFDELQKASTRQSSILNALPANIALLDKKGNIIAVNEAWKQYGINNNLKWGNFCLGENYLTISEKAQGEDAKIAREMVKGIKAVIKGNKKAFSLEYPCHSPEEQSWFEAIITPLVEQDKSGVVVTHINITERVLAEKNILRSNERYKIVTQATNDAIWDWNFSKNELYWSDGYEKLFGYTVTDKDTIDDWRERIHPDDRERILKSIDIYINNYQNDYWQAEYRYLRKDGLYAFVFDRGSIILNEENKPIRMVGAMQDITSKKLAEIERNKMTADLIQRNLDLEQFTYIVSHNLRSPVANILGCADILSDPVYDENTKIEILKGLSSATKKLDSVIWDLNYILQIKQDINEKKELIKFSVLVEDIKISIDNQIKKEEVKIITNFCELDQLFSLKTYLYSIFYNLITNSIKYRQEKISPIIEISSRINTEGVELRFKDNGRGIDLTKKGTHVFGLYKRFHQEIEGKGMGLFMVKTQVETLGGKINIESEVNKGTTFIIQFNL